MKKILAFAFFLLSVASFATAQTQPANTKGGEALPLKTATVTTEPVVREATDKLVQKYTLNADQAKQMYTIQARKQRNLQAIEVLKTSNPALYQGKLKNVQQGTLASIRRILRTKEQMKLYQKTQTQVRIQQAEKRKQMMLQNAAKSEIENAVIAVYAE